jgi:hypothetical protein
MRGARGDTARTCETSTTPPSAARSARCASAGACPQTSTAAPEAWHDQAPSRDQGHPGGAHGRENDPSASRGMVRRCPPVSPLFASWPWLLHTGRSLEAVAMTGHERNHEKGYSRHMPCREMRALRFAQERDEACAFPSLSAAPSTRLLCPPHLPARRIVECAWYWARRADGLHGEMDAL